MLKIFVVAVLAIAMSVGVAEARGTTHVDLLPNFPPVIS
jgi:hypothetical protein